MRSQPSVLLAVAACGAGLVLGPMQLSAAAPPLTRTTSTRASPAAETPAILDIAVSATQTPTIVNPDALDVLVFSVAITNNHLVARSLRSLRLVNTTTGPGTVAQRDAELGKAVRLYRDKGNGHLDGSDEKLAEASAQNGAVLFDFPNQSIPANGGTLRLLVVTDVPLVARDGDALDVEIQSGADLTFDEAVTYSNVFPVAPAGSFPIDGMIAAQVAVGPGGTGQLLAGTSNNLALNVLLPANGYEPDLLQKLAVVNTGTAAAGSEITAIRAWADDGDGAFEPAQDRMLGALAFTGALWQVSGISEAVPVAGLRVFFTVDISDFATEGRTVRLALPDAPDLGVAVASNNDGPLDRNVESPIERAVSTANRITLATVSLPSGLARPGQRDVPLLQFAAANSYATNQVLDRLTVTNAGVGGTIEQRDRAVQRLTLRRDGDGNGALGDSLADPVVAHGFYFDGQASFQGLGLTIPPGSSKHLFVTADVALTTAADGDTLALRVAGPLDVAFSDTTRVLASWPLDSRARVAVDGMVADQVIVTPTTAGTLAPDDANVLALDLIVPRNGYANDLVQQIEVVNLGTADNLDVAELRWWRDGGDGVFTPGSGDDADLGAASWTGDGWLRTPLAEPVGAGGARLFAALRVASAPRDSATIQLAVRLLGITVATGNDGPLDRMVKNPTTLLISNSPLLAALAISPPSSTTGQPVNVEMVVRNVGGETLMSVTASALTASGGGSLTAQSGPTPASLDLAPGEQDTIRWTYSAGTPGTVRLTGYAQGTGNPSGTPRRSLDASSGLHRVFSPVSQLDAEVFPALPPTVNRGQLGVVPMLLRFSNRGGAEGASVRLRALRIALEDEGGAGVVPDRLLARVAVNQGTTEHLSRTVLEASGSQVDLTLAVPVVIEAEQIADLTLTFDVAAGTTVAAFRVALLDSAWWMAEDVNSGAPVAVRLVNGTLPLRTSLTRVVEAPTRIEVTAVADSCVRAGAGQSDVPLLTVRLLNPGTDGITNDVRVSALALDASDTVGVQLARLADELSWIRVRTAFQTVASRGVFAADGSMLTLLLSPMLSVPVNTPVDLMVSGDLAAGAPPGAFHLRLTDSTRFDARDANTHDRVTVAFAADPLRGRKVLVETPAETLHVRGVPRLPGAARAGEANVAAMSVVLYHRGPPAAARVRVDSIVILTRDEARRPLAPSSYLERVRLLWNGTETGVRNDPPATGEATAVSVGARMLAPGDSATLDVVVDFAAVAPEGFLEMSVFGDGLHAVDANLGTRVAIVPAAGQLPLVSGLTRLQAPPRTLVAGLATSMPATLAGDGREVAAGVLTLTNPAASGAGTIAVSHLVVRATDRDLAVSPLGAGVERLDVYANGTLWAQGAALTPDSLVATLAGASPLQIAPGPPVAVELRLITRSGVTGGSLRIGLDQIDVGVVQPGSALLQIQVLPASGQTFPLWTEAGSFGPTDLAASYSNFPNPFGAGREATRFVYHLDAPARAWLRVFTLVGEPVATLVDGARRDAGTHQDDRWDGRNGVGRTVRNGVYVAELLVRYDDGRAARALRKVAVVR